MQKCAQLFMENSSIPGSLQTSPEQKLETCAEAQQREQRRCTLQGTGAGSRGVLEWQGCAPQTGMAHTSFMSSHTPSTGSVLLRPRSC